MIGCTRSENPATGCVDFRKNDRLVFRTHPQREKGKLIFQIGTANADLAVEAAKIVAGDVAGIDVNAGCPKVRPPGIERPRPRKTDEPPNSSTSRSTPAWVLVS